jgi:hypothetical protein
MSKKKLIAIESIVESGVKHHKPPSIESTEKVLS